jgi:hypothetical protein
MLIARTTAQGGVLKVNFEAPIPRASVVSERIYFRPARSFVGWSDFNTWEIVESTEQTQVAVRVRGGGGQQVGIPSNCSSWDCGYYAALESNYSVAVPQCIIAGNLSSACDGETITVYYD